VATRIIILFRHLLLVVFVLIADPLEYQDCSNQKRCLSFFIISGTSLLLSGYAH
jgi:hypothetical protein